MSPAKLLTPPAALQHHSCRQAPDTFPRSCRLPPELIPEHSLGQNSWQVVASDKEAFLHHLRAGHITPVKGACCLTQRKAALQRTASFGRGTSLVHRLSRLHQPAAAAAALAAILTVRISVAGQVLCLEPGTVVLQDGRRLAADVFVHALGYDKQYSCLAGLSKELGRQHDGLHLYRDTLPVGVKVLPPTYMNLLHLWQTWSDALTGIQTAVVASRCSLLA